MPSTVTEAYRVISEGLLEGFKLLGFEAYFMIPRSKEEREKLKQPEVLFVLMHLVGMN